MTARALPWLGVLGGGLLMVVPKATVPLIVGAGLFGLYGFLHGRGRERLAIENRPLLVVSCLGAALVAWALVTAFWAPDASGAALQAAKVGALCTAGMLAVFGAATLSSRRNRQAGGSFVWAICAAVAMLVIGQAYAQATGDALWGRYSKDPLTTMSNGAAILAVMVWPAVAVLWGRGQRSWGVVLAVAVATVLVPLHSDAALVALVVGGVVFAAAIQWRRGTCRTAAGLAAAGIILMPVMVAVMSPSEGLRSRLEAGRSSIAHRLLIWDYTVEKIKQRPLAGWGMDASRHMGGEAKVMGFLEQMPLHPHNGALQVWLELGIAGAALAAALAGLVFLGAARLNGLMTAGAGAAGAGYLVIGSLSYGVWQNWWIAVAWVVAATACMLGRTETA